MSSFRKYDNKREEVESLIKQGVAKKDIARVTGMSTVTLLDYLKRWGLYESPKRNTKPPKRKGKYDHLRDDIETAVMNGERLFDIADKFEIPRGSIYFTLNRWGIAGQQLEARSSFYTDGGRVLASKRNKPDYSGEKHHFYGKVALRGQWVTRKEFLAEAQKLLDQDMTYAQMTQELGISQATLWSRLKEAGLLRGIRTEKRAMLWKGGHRKYRGPGWQQARKLCLERDGYTCTKCGRTNAEELKLRHRQLSVHHIIPWEESRDSSLDNLTTLCQSCHMETEHANGRHRK